MRLPAAAHTSQPWRIHELAPDFRLEDVWALDTPGGRTDFPRLVQQFTRGDPSLTLPAAARAAWALRMKLGQLLGWDERASGTSFRTPTLRERLAHDNRQASAGPAFATLPFTSLYLLEDEWAAETANRTMHGVLHLGWIEESDGGYRAQMAVLVKPNGLFGTAYMAAIRPFRHQLIYPALIHQIEAGWRRRLVHASPQGDSA